MIQISGDSWCFIASTREFLNSTGVIKVFSLFFLFFLSFLRSLSLIHSLTHSLSLLRRPPKKQHIFVQRIYFHCELEFISFDWEHGVMENILMFYVPYIRKCYNPKNYIKYITFWALLLLLVLVPMWLFVLCCVFYWQCRRDETQIS